MDVPKRGSQMLSERRRLYTLTYQRAGAGIRLPLVGSKTRLVLYRTA